MTEHVDVLVIGAGLSGIGAAHRLSTLCPDRTLAVLEGRERKGGTWDLFRYPGVRSDSDMFTLGYQFNPWRGEKAIASGQTILDYIEETADTFGLERFVRYQHRVVAADWSSADARWTVDAETPDGLVRMTCGFLYACSGYYDYEEPYDAQLPGLDAFAGEVVHPQFWPESLSWKGKRVLIVGSGATAVTLVPNLATDAAHVTMLQRSPTWIAALPSADPWADRVRRRLPASVAHRIIRARRIGFITTLTTLSRRFPARMRARFLGALTEALGEELVDPHLTPSYDPWEQRLCVAPDGDFFQALTSGAAEIVTDHIETFVPEGVRLRSGRTLDADVVVTATGLRVQLLGGARWTVDGQEVDLSEEFMWQGAMVSGVPNFAICIGYTMASWTLRADLTHRLVCRVLNLMTREGQDVAVPDPPAGLRPRPILDLSSGYLARATDDLPRQGHRGPWRVLPSYPLDALAIRLADPRRGLRLSPSSTGAQADRSAAG